MNLDLVGAFLTGWVAVSCFLLHVFSSARYKRHLPIPQYVRSGFILTGLMFMWRSVNFISLPLSEPLGHINAEGVMALIAVAYTISALACWVFQTADLHLRTRAPAIDRR